MQSVYLFMRCNICYLPIQEERSRSNCPRCFNDFHKDHLAAWLLSHDYCPMCKETLSETFREDMRPKTEDERARLENILSRLDGLGDMFKQLENSQKKRIMRSREREFGIDSGGFMTYFKLAVPGILFLLFIFFIILAVTN